MQENNIKKTNRGVYENTAYRYYVLGILVLVYIFNFVDRQILSILLQPIKEDLQVSDTLMGFLLGTAFALFYAVMGIPIARLADRKSRTWIITISLTLWSGMTAVSGIVTNFIQLAIARVGVAVGEAGCSPSAHSILADIFEKKQRASALSIYSIGIPIGSMIGLMVGGYISEAYSWRTAFFLVGIPGIILAAIFIITVREPVRGGSEEKSNEASKNPKKIAQKTDTKQAVVTEEVEVSPSISLSLVIRVLLRQKSFINLSMGAALNAFVGYGLGAFTAAYVERQWGIPRSEIGFDLGLIGGLSGMAGILFGGFVSDILSKRSRRWYMILPALALGISFPFYLGVYSVASYSLLLVFLVVPSFLGNLYAGPSFAATQSLVPVKMRAFAAAILLFIINLIGLGGGPQLVGLVSDGFNTVIFASGDDASALKYALILASVLKFVAAYYFWRASKTIETDFDRVQEYEKALSEGKLEAMLPWKLWEDNWFIRSFFKMVGKKI